MIVVEQGLGACCLRGFMAILYICLTVENRKSSPESFHVVTKSRQYFLLLLNRLYVQDMHQMCSMGRKAFSGFCIIVIYQKS